MQSPVMNALSGHCPMCGEGRAFDGPIAMKHECEVCGSIFDRDEGFWTGAITLPYIFASFWVVGLLSIVFAMGRIMDPNLVWFVPGSTVLFAGLVYPISKRFWLGLYGEWGYLYPDPADKPSETEAPVAEAG